MKTAMAKLLHGSRSGASLLHAGGGWVLGPTVPPPDTATMGIGGPEASSQSLLQAAGRRMPQEGGLASLLPRLGATVPPPTTFAAAGVGSGASSPSLLQGQKKK
ncbi:unnamed protein product, partial [Urochloa humidicola]